MALLPPPGANTRILFNCVRSAIVTLFIGFFLVFFLGRGVEIREGLIPVRSFQAEDAIGDLSGVISIPLLFFVALFAASAQWKLLAQTFVILILVILIQIFNVRY